MKEASPAEIQPSEMAPRLNVNAWVGVVFSGFALAGWILTLGLVFLVSDSYEEYTDDGQRNVAIGLNNFLLYLFQVATGILGLLVCGFFSAAGAIISALGLTSQPRTLAAWGLGAGIAGVTIGLGMILWRMSAWGLF